VPATREIRQARFADWSPLRASANPSFLAIVAVEYADGGSESCLVPLALVDGDATDAALKNTPGSVLARITGARNGAIVDGLHDDDTCDRLVGIIDGVREVATKHGSVQGIRMSPALEVSESRRRVRGQADHSHTVAFLADRCVLKLFRRIEPTWNPELEIGRFLTERGFTRTPALAGALEYLRPGLEPGTLAVLQALVTHQGTGWEFAIDELRRYYERVSARVKRTS
jgi:maltose alpha-D-glucosyltransferase/alpha-amylase